MAIRIRQHVFGEQHRPVYAMITGILGILLFLVPLLFLPMMVDAWETTKTSFFILGMLAVTLLTLFLSSRENRLPRILHRGDWFWAAFVVLYVLSLLLSVHPATSLFGVRGAYAESLLSFGSLLLFFYAVRVFFRDVRLVFISFWILMTSLTLAALFYLMGVLGFPLFGDVSTLPFLANSLVMVSVSSAIVLSVLLYTLLSGHTGELRMVVLAGMVIHALLLIVLDLNIAWYMLLLALLLMVYLFGIRGKLYSRFRVSMVLLVAALSIVFLILDLNSLTKVKLSQDVLLGQNASARIVLETIKAHPVLGSGPDTFMYDYLQFAPSEIYQSGVNFSFVRAGSQWWQWMATLGLGGVVLVGLFLGSLVRLFLVLVPTKHGDADFGIRGLDVAFLGQALLLFVSFFFPVHFSLLLAWFFFLGMTEVLLQLQKKGKGDVLLPPRTQQQHTAAAVVLSLLVLTGGVFAVRVWGAELAFGSAINRAEDATDFDSIESRLRLAGRLASWDGAAQAALGEHLAIRNLLEGEDAARTQESVSRIAKARALDPRQPSIIASLFRVNSFLGNASPYTIADLEDALTIQITQEPNQAMHYLAYAQFLLEVFQAQGAESDSPLLAQAEDYLTAAKERNPFLPGIDFTQARLYSLTGRHEDAIAILEALTKFYPDVQDFQDALEQEKQAAAGTDTPAESESEQSGN